MKAMEQGTYFEFLSILNNYLEKKEVEQKEYDKIKAKMGHGRSK